MKEITEKFKKGKDWNKTKISQLIYKLTDDDMNFIGNYEVTLEIKNQKEKAE